MGGAGSLVDWPALSPSSQERSGKKGCACRLCVWWKGTAASSLTCWTTRPWGFSGPLPRPPSVPCDPSLCPLDDLVEKKPCSWNSPRVCECRAGMFCATSATNSCARCFPHSDCPPGMIVKFQGKCLHPQLGTKTRADATPHVDLQVTSNLPRPPSCWMDPVCFLHDAMDARGPQSPLLPFPMPCVPG